MPEKTISDDQGEIFRLIARTKTTPRANESVKSINTDSDTIKVLVFDAIMTSAGSQFGHVAIDIDGTIYSRAHSKYAILSDGMQYRKSNQLIRSFEELILRVSREEKMKIETELKRRVEVDKPYSIIDNSCSTNIADVLESIGILAHDPRYMLDPKSTDMVSPKELLIIVSRSKRIVRRIHHEKIER